MEGRLSTRRYRHRSRCPASRLATELNPNGLDRPKADARQPSGDLAVKTARCASKARL